MMMMMVKVTEFSRLLSALGKRFLLSGG